MIAATDSARSICARDNFCSSVLSNERESKRDDRGRSDRVDVVAGDGLHERLVERERRRDHDVQLGKQQRQRSEVERIRKNETAKTRDKHTRNESMRRANQTPTKTELIGVAKKKRHICTLAFSVFRPSASSDVVSR